MECGICGGPLMLLGVLGNLKHLRCRDCGMQFSKKVRSRRKFSSKRKVVKNG